METNLTLNAQITADVGKFITSLDRVNKSVEKAATKMKDVGKKMSTYLTLPLVAAGGVAVANAVKFEKLATSLNVLTGSAEAGAKAFERLKTFSASTPFQLDELVSVNNQLMGFGLTTDKAFESLQMLGDVASVSGADLARVAVAFGQSAAAGRVMTQDLNQFINNGIPIYQLLGDVTGKNVGELRDLASQGKITFDLLEQAFKKGTSEGGKFFGGTSKLSKTLGGRLSTLRDNFNLMMGDIGQLIGEFLSPLISVATKLMQGFQGLSSTTKTIIVVVAGLAAALGPLIFSIGAISSILPILTLGMAKLSVAVNSISLPVVAVTALILSLAAAAVYLWDNWQLVVKHLQNGFKKLKNAALTMAQGVVKHLAFLAQGFVNLANLAGFELSNPLTALVGKLEGLKETIIPVTGEFGSFGDAMRNVGVAMGLVNGQAAGAASGIKKIGDEAKKANEAVTTLNTTLSDGGGGSSEGADAKSGMASGVQRGAIEVQTFADDYTDSVNSMVAANAALATSTADGVSSMIGSFRQLAGDSKALAMFEIAVNTARGIAAAVQAGAGLVFPANIGAIAAGVGAVVSGIASAKQALSSAPAFATGGIVGGSSFSGDRVIARVNSGEMILNGGQQNRLFNMINGGNASGGGGFVASTKIQGSDLLVSIERATNQRNRTRGF